MHRKHTLRLAAFLLSAALVLSAFFAACGRQQRTDAITEQTPAPTEVPEPDKPFDVYADYDQWTEDEGYESGQLVPEGPEGLYQDHYRTLPDTEAYTSGRIVIGDSRCCQLGIYEQRAGRSDFAVFAVWGGHYAEGAYPSIMKQNIVSEIEACFREQIRTAGECTVFFFATVNDYDRTDERNAASIAAAIEAAEYFASMSCELDGRTFHPRVVVIGFDGCRRDGQNGSESEVFNRYIAAYNSALREAVAASELLSPGLRYFTDVPEIMDGNCGFINDRLHYDDRTLKAICDFIISVGG